MNNHVYTPSGAKAYQRRDTEDRTKRFRDWHRTLDRSLMATDADLIEWRWGVNGELVPVAVFELTRVDYGIAVNDNYLNAITYRYEKDLQGRAARALSQRLGAPAYILLFREDLSEFWVYDLVRRTGWVRLSKAGMTEFLETL